MIYFPYNEEMCSYTDTWMGELYENEYPLVSKGVWSGIINLKTHKLLNSKPEYGSLYLQAKVCDSGTYFLLDKDKKTLRLLRKSMCTLKKKSILYIKVEFIYNQLMAKLFRLPKFIQMEIGKALIANASEEFEKEE